MKTKIKEFLVSILWLFKIASLITVGLTLLAGIVCLIVGWRSIDEYATVLQYVGIGAFFLGGIGFLLNLGDRW